MVPVPDVGLVKTVGDPTAQVLAPVKATLRGHRRNDEIFELFGKVIVIVNWLTTRFPELLTKKVLAVPFATDVESVTPVLV